MHIACLYWRTQEPLTPYQSRHLRINPLQMTKGLIDRITCKGTPCLTRKFEQLAYLMTAPGVELKPVDLEFNKLTTTPTRITRNLIDTPNDKQMHCTRYRKHEVLAKRYALIVVLTHFKLNLSRKSHLKNTMTNILIDEINIYSLLYERHSLKQFSKSLSYQFLVRIIYLSDLLMCSLFDHPIVIRRLLSSPPVTSQ